MFLRTGQPNLRVSLAWNSTSRPDWLATEPQGSSCTSVPGFRCELLHPGFSCRCGQSKLMRFTDSQSSRPRPSFKPLKGQLTTVWARAGTRPESLPRDALESDIWDSEWIR